MGGGGGACCGGDGGSGGCCGLIGGCADQGSTNGSGNSGDSVWDSGSGDKNISN